MSQCITLLGSEDVSRAGHNMEHAAERMQQAATSISESLWRQQNFMDEWLRRFEEALAASKDHK